MSLSLQAKLLRVLQDGGIRRVGGAQIIPVNVRIIVATNANLEEMVEQRLLRADLYYRINVLSLTIPPLRERPQDISLLIRHFVQKYAKEFQRRIILDKACFDALHHHTAGKRARTGKYHYSPDADGGIRCYYAGRIRDGEFACR